MKPLKLTLTKKQIEEIRHKRGNFENPPPKYLRNKFYTWEGGTKRQPRFKFERGKQVLDGVKFINDLVDPARDECMNHGALLIEGIVPETDGRNTATIALKKW